MAFKKHANTTWKIDMTGWVIKTYSGNIVFVQFCWKKKLFPVAPWPSRDTSVIQSW